MVNNTLYYYYFKYNSPIYKTQKISTIKSQFLFHFISFRYKLLLLFEKSPIENLSIYI